MASAKPRSRMFSPHRRGAAHVAVLGAAALGLGSLGAAVSVQPAWEMTAYEGVSHPSDIRELAFGARGRVAEVVVKPGDHVVPGDLVIRLEDAVQQQTTALARAQATDGRRSWPGASPFRFNDLAQVREAHGGGGANDRELQDAEYRLAMAELERTAAWSAFEQAGLVLAREEARLAEMSIHSPIQGIVVDVLRRGGEAVDEQTRVVTVIRVDPLWIDVNVRRVRRLQRGQKASVVWRTLTRPRRARAGLSSSPRRGTLGRGRSRCGSRYRTPTGCRQAFTRRSGSCLRRPMRPWRRHRPRARMSRHRRAPLRGFGPRSSCRGANILFRAAGRRQTPPPRGLEFRSHAPERGVPGGRESSRDLVFSVQKGCTRCRTPRSSVRSRCASTSRR